MFRKLLLLSGASLAVCCSCGAAAAAEDPSPGRFYVHLGPAGLFQSGGTKIYAAGTQIPGATVKIDDSVTAAAEVGYFVTPNIAVSFTGGYPPTIHAYGAGSLAGTGELATAVFGPMSLTAHYHLLSLGRFRPYVGGGVVFMHIFSTSDRLLSNVDVKDHFGYAGQVGADYVINNRWGAFVDFKKAHLRTSATGDLMGLPLSAKVKLDTAVVSGGVSYRF